MKSKVDPDLQRLRCSAKTVFLALLFVVSIGAAPALAQQPGSPGAPVIKDPRSESIQRQNREATLRSAELVVPPEKIDQARIKLAIDQMREDFRRIQVVRNEIARIVLSDKAIDFKQVSTEVIEVGKRAERLKGYLMPAGSQQKKTEVDPAEIGREDMKPALTKLCKLIDRFVDNPVLKEPGTTNIEQSAQLGRDLVSIVELSGNIKKCAEKIKE
ncbi:MAG TPA: hypothetical protein VKM94_21405 [Blastocatellia bacterium]|nr:hypothetical protein [Blastocatellia bacterium]